MKMPTLQLGCPTPVEHDLLAVERGGGLHVGGIGGGDVGLGHAEGRADLAGEQGGEPALALLGGAEVQQHLHVAGVGGVAVEALAGDQRAAHALSEGRVLDVGQTCTGLGVTLAGIPHGWGRTGGQEQVPQTFGLGLGLEFLDQGGHHPGVPQRELRAMVGLLARRDLALDEGAEALQQLLRAR
jgi:hypothetical protein